MKAPDPRSDPLAQKLWALATLCQDVGRRIRAGEKDYHDDAAMAVQILLGEDAAATGEFLISENGVHRAMQALTRFTYPGIPQLPPCEWTCAVSRSSHGIWKASFWLLPRFEDRIQSLVEGADRMRTIHASFFKVYRDFAHRIRDKRIVEAAHEQVVAAERAENALFEERIRLAQEHVRVEAERRAKRASQDAEWDSAAPA